MTITFDLTVKDLEESFVYPYTEGRYPYTYACDYVRAHQGFIKQKLGLDDLAFPFVSSRGEASQFMQFLNNGSSEYYHIAIVFADAHMAEHNIVKD